MHCSNMHNCQVNKVKVHQINSKRIKNVIYPSTEYYPSIHKRKYQYTLQHGKTLKTLNWRKPDTKTHMLHVSNHMKNPEQNTL